ncbi:MAG: hypothetical protein WC862_03095 [Patescibacteria group bacterium]
MWILVLQRMALDFFLDFLFFPFWWYTKGAKHALLFCFHLLQDGNLRLSPWLWIRNVFVPMFGQRDIGGRLVSIFMRLVNFIGRSAALLFWLFAVIIIFFIWLFLPVFVLFMLVRSF